MEKVLVCFIVMICVGVRGDSSGCDGVPLLVSPDDCCKLPNFFSNNLMQKCLLDNYSRIEYIPPTKIPRAPPLPAAVLKSAPAIIPHGGCIYECAFNATGIELSDEGMDMMVISTYFTSAVQDSMWDDILVDALERCVRDTHSKLPGFRVIVNTTPIESGQKYCNPMAGYLMGCLNTYLFLKCPEDLWTNSRDCRDLKIYQEKCPQPLSAGKLK